MACARPPCERSTPLAAWYLPVMLRATRWSSLLTLWVAAFVAVPGRAQAAPAERAYVGVYLHDVTRFDQRNGTYDVDADVWLKWYGELDPSALRVQNSCFDMEMVDLGESSDGDWHSHRYHLRGMLRGEFPLHRFPFDTQHLGIQFELSGSSAELVPDLTGSGMASRFSVTGWDYEPEFQPRMQELLYASDLGSIEGEGRSTTIQRVGFEVTLQRPTITIAVKCSCRCCCCCSLHCSRSIWRPIWSTPARASA